jgi:hypothetical protein
MNVESKVSVIVWAGVTGWAVAGIGNAFDLEGMAAQRLVRRTSVEREHLRQHLGRRPIRHQGRELSLQPVQLRGRADMRRPCHARLGRAAAGTAEAGQPHRDLPEQRGDRVLAVVLDPTHITAAAARRTAHGMDPGLRGDDLSLDASQELLTLSQGQTQAGQVGEVVRSGDPHDVGVVFFALRSDAHQLHDPGHGVSTSTGTPA